jgi:hypothetical protein
LASKTHAPPGLHEAAGEPTCCVDGALSRTLPAASVMRTTILRRLGRS